MMAKIASARTDKLAAMRAKLLAADTGGASMGWWSPKEGRNLIRILPAVHEMDPDQFWQQVGRHDFPPDGKKHAYCPKFTAGKDCPICEIVTDLYRAGDKASTAMAGQLNRRRMYWINIIDRADEDAGPKIYTPGVTVFNQLVEIINDPDYGDVTDLDAGFDLKLVRKGSGINTEYMLSAVRDSSPLHEDPETVEKWLEAARDLSYAEISDDPSEDAALSKGHAIFILPYSRLVKEFDLDNLELDEPEDEDEPEEKPSRSKQAVKAAEKAAATQSAKVARKAISEPVEDDEDAEDEDLDDAEDEEPPSKQREVVRRQARRSTMR